MVQDEVWINVLNKQKYCKNVNDLISNWTIAENNVSIGNKD